MTEREKEIEEEIQEMIEVFQKDRDPLTERDIQGIRRFVETLFALEGDDEDI